MPVLFGCHCLMWQMSELLIHTNACLLGTVKFDFFVHRYISYAANMMLVRGRDRICNETLRGRINKYRCIIVLSTPRQPWNICISTAHAGYRIPFYSPKFLRALHNSGYFLNVTMHIIQQTRPPHMTRYKN